MVIIIVIAVVIIIASGMCYPVCGMMHIKDPLLLIGKSSPSAAIPYKGGGGGVIVAHRNLHFFLFFSFLYSRKQHRNASVSFHVVCLSCTR